jgi:menaquinone-dependent protoporphyrinogen oxidase
MVKLIDNKATPTPTRRGALRKLGWGLGGLAVLATGFVGRALQRPSWESLPSSCAGGHAMKQRVLVAYASRAGSTAQIAQAIGQQLCAMGWDADVQEVQAVRNLDDFQAVVLGSAIRYGQWLPEMSKFVQAQRLALGRLPVALFTAHMQALDDTTASVQARTAYTRDIHAWVTPRAEAFFAGKIDLQTLSFFERMAVKLVKSPIGDKRDWSRIQAWASSLQNSLQRQ